MATAAARPDPDAKLRTYLQERVVKYMDAFGEPHYVLMRVECNLDDWTEAKMDDARMVGLDHLPLPTPGKQQMIRVHGAPLPTQAERTPPVVLEPYHLDKLRSFPKHPHMTCVYVAFLDRGYYLYMPNKGFEPCVL